MKLTIFEHWLYDIPLYLPYNTSDIIEFYISLKEFYSIRTLCKTLGVAEQTIYNFNYDIKNNMDKAVKSIVYKNLVKIVESVLYNG